MRVSFSWRSASHPSLDQLVLYVDQQLGWWERCEVRRHVADCLQCRRTCTRLMEGAGLFVDLYEEAMESLPVPAAGLGTLRRGMDKSTPPKRAWFWSPSKRTHWATLAGLLIGTLIVVAVALLPVTAPPRLNAAEVLIRSERSMRQDTAPRTHRITVRSAKSTKAIQVRGGRRIAMPPKDTKEEIRSTLARIDFDWNNPLSPAGFRKWHAGLRSAVDSVTEDSERITVATKAPAEALISSRSLTVRRLDYRPVREYLALATSESVEIEELPSEARPETLDGLSRIVPPESPNESVPSPVAPGVDEAAVEIEALSVLHTIGADRDFDPSFRGLGTAVGMKGLVASEQQRHAIAAALREVSGLRIQIRSRESAAPGPMKENPAAPVKRILQPRLALEPLAAQALAVYFGDAAGALADRLLENSVILNERLYRLLHISEAYSEPAVARFSAKAAHRYSELVRTLMCEFVSTAREDERLQAQLRAALPRAVRPVPGRQGCQGWRRDILGARTAVSENSRLYWRLFAVTRAEAPDGQSLGAAMERMAANNETIQSAVICMDGQAGSDLIH